MTPAQQRYYDKNRDQVIARAAQWNKANAKPRSTQRRMTYHGKSYAYRRDQQLQQQYGITLEQYHKMLVAQQGCCANPGCRQDTPGGPHGTWCVDHSHDTGEVRGLLCWNCNLLLGHAREDAFRLAGAIEYLARFNCPTLH